MLSTTFSVFIVALLFCCPLYTINAQDNNRVYMTAVAWSPDGRLLAAVGIVSPATHGVIRVTDAEGEVVYTLNTEPGGFAAVDWSPDGRYIAAGSYDQSIWIIDVKKQEHVQTLWGHRWIVNSLDWSSDGSRLVSTGNVDSQVILWDMATYQPIQIYDIADPWTAAFSPDSERIAVGGIAGLVVFPVSLRTTNIFEYRIYADAYIGGLEWNADGTRIAFGTHTFYSVTRNYLPSATLRIVDSVSGELIRNIETQTDTIFGVTWSASDELIATYSLDGIVKIWAPDTGLEVNHFIGNTNYGSSRLAFSSFDGSLAYGITIPANEALSQLVVPEGVAILAADHLRRQ